MFSAEKNYRIMRINLLCPETDTFDAAVKNFKDNWNSETKSYKENTESEMPSITDLSKLTGFIRVLLYT